MTDEEIKALQDELESVRGELEGLNMEKAALGSELAAKNARISELEQALGKKAYELESLGKALGR